MGRTHPLLRLPLCLMWAAVFLSWKRSSQSRTSEQWRWQGRALNTEYRSRFVPVRRPLNTACAVRHHSCEWDRATWGCFGSVPPRLGEFWFGWCDPLLIPTCRSPVLFSLSSCWQLRELCHSEGMGDVISEAGLCLYWGLLYLQGCSLVSCST